MADGAGPSNSQQQGDPEQPKRLRVYEQWEGAEVFFCGGRCMAGPSWKSTIGTASMIIIPSIVFWALVIPKFLSNVGLAALFWAVSLVLTGLSLSFLFTTACIDPGVIPRNPEPDVDYIAGKKPRTTEVEVNGQKVIVRYNESCGFYQPPRAHHCSVNDNCIERFDHHCPWVGTTIGRRNYRFFLLFVFTTTVLCMYTTGICLFQLFYSVSEVESSRSSGAAAPTPTTTATPVALNETEVGGFAPALENNNNNLWVEVILDSIASVVLMGYCFLLMFFVGGLASFHSYLVSTNQTTYENFRYSSDSRPNPYNVGCMKNCAEVFCNPVPKSKINLRAYVDEWNPVIPDIQHMRREDLQANGGAPSQKNGTPGSSAAPAANNGAAAQAPGVSTQGVEIEMTPGNGSNAGGR